MRIQITASTGSHGRVSPRNMSLSEGKTYTVSFMARASRDAVKLNYLYFMSQSIGNSSFGSEISIGTTWKRYSTSLTIPAGRSASDYGLLLGMLISDGLVQSGDWIEFDYVQVEEKAYATSFAVGAKAAETLTVLTTGWINGDWCVGLDYTPPVNQNVPGVTRRLLDLSVDASNYVRLNVDATGRPYLAVTSGGVEVNTLDAADPVLQAGTKYRLTARGDGSNMALLINGVLSARGPVAYAEPVGVIPDALYVGSSAAGDAHANGVYGNLHISHALTDEEIAAEYAAGEPIRKIHTIGIYPFNSSLANIASGNQNAAFANAWRVDRREVGGAWVQLIEVPNPASGRVRYTDYAPGSGVPYEYRVVALGQNGTETAGQGVAATVSFATWLFWPISGERAAWFAYNTSVSWQPEDDVNVPETQSRYRREYRGPSHAVLADITATFKDRDGLTARQWRELVKEYARLGTVGYLKGPNGDVWRGTLRLSRAQPDDRFGLETVRLTFRQTKGAA